MAYTARLDVLEHGQARTAFNPAVLKAQRAHAPQNGLLDRNACFAGVHEDLRACCHTVAGRIICGRVQVEFNDIGHAHQRQAAALRDHLVCVLALIVQLDVKAVRLKQRCNRVRHAACLDRLSVAAAHRARIVGRAAVTGNE